MANAIPFSKPASTGVSDDRGINLDFLQLAKRRFRTAMDAESELREKMLGDMEFYASDQWDDDVRAERTADGKPTLTINRIPQFVRQVTNQQRASRPAVQVSPLGGDASVDTAECIQGMIRSIEVNSDSDVAYATAGEHQAICGRGWFRLHTEYASDDGYEQVIVFRRVPDPLSVVPDPAYSEVDGRDMRYCFIFEDMPRDEFIAQYGEDAASEYMAWQSTRDRAPEWLPEGRLRIAEYMYVESDQEVIVDVRIPGEQGADDVIQCLKSELPDDLPDAWKVTNQRTITRNRVFWSKITPTRILEGNDDLTAGRSFPCRWIPVVPVIGDEIVVGGKRDLRGMVRDAKDPQRMYSYWASSLTETIALTPRAPYIGFEGQFAGHEAKWNRANRKNYAYLEVKPITLGGQPVQLPQRQQFEPAIQAIVEAFQLADNDLKAVMGLYDASLGASGPEQSGKAILARQRQGEMGNSNFMDNLGRSIRHGGRIILDMIPRVYTPLRVMQIIGNDNKPQPAILANGASPADVQRAQAQLQKQGAAVAKVFDISVGRYDVSISDGPSYASRRQEAVNSMLQLINTYPQAAPVIGDLLVKNMDWPGASEIAARLRKLLPANLLDPSDPNYDPAPQQYHQQMQDAQKALAKIKADLQTKVLELQVKMEMQIRDIESRERTAKMQSDATVMSAEVKAHFDAVTIQMQQEFDAMQQRLDLLHTAGQAAADREHQTELAAMQAATAANLPPGASGGAAASGGNNPQPSAGGRPS